MPSSNHIYTYGYRLNPDRPRDPAGVRREEAEAACVAEISPLQPIGRRNSSQETSCEEWIEVGQVPAIVSKEQFEMVQAKLAHNQSFAKRNNTSHPYLLRAMLSCGLCGLSCNGRSSKT